MKISSRLKLIICSGIIILSTLALFQYNASAVELVDEEPIYLGEATITCSSGISGKCFKIKYDMEIYSSIGEYVCDWTGSPSNRCSLFLVKTFNIFIDYVM